MHNYKPNIKFLMINITSIVNQMEKFKKQEKKYY